MPQVRPPRRHRQQSSRAPDDAVRLSCRPVNLLLHESARSRSRAVLSCCPFDPTAVDVSVAAATVRGSTRLLRYNLGHHFLRHPL